MLQEELTFELLSQGTGIAYEQIPKLWTAFLQQVEQRLGSTSCIDFSPLGFWSLKLSDEFIADIQGAQSFIIPPRLTLDITPEPKGEVKNIYSLDDCLEGLILATKLSEKTVKIFLSDLTQLINKELEEKQEFYCPKLGIISLTRDEEGKPLGYKLSLEQSFAESLNKPFAMFSPIEVQGLSKEKVQLEVRSLNSLDETKLPLECYYQNNSVMEEEINKNLDLGSEGDEEYIPPITENEELPLSEDEVEEDFKKETKTEDLGAIDEDEEQKKVEKSRRRGCMLYIFAFLLLLGLLYVLFLALKSYQEQEELKAIQQEQAQNLEQQARLDSLQQAKSDSLKLVKEQEEPAEELKIRSGHTLRKIAQKKYGHKVFWIYIYQENKDIIKNPNNVPIGTKLKLPPKSKYNIDAKDTKSIKKALELERKFYNQSK